jgi:hypothetical protein
MDMRGLITRHLISVGSGLGDAPRNGSGISECPQICGPTNKQIFETPFVFHKKLAISTRQPFYFNNLQRMKLIIPGLLLGLLVCSCHSSRLAADSAQTEPAVSNASAPADTAPATDANSLENLQPNSEVPRTLTNAPTK